MPHFSFRIEGTFPILQTSYITVIRRSTQRVTVSFRLLLTAVYSDSFIRPRRNVVRSTTFICVKVAVEGIKDHALHSRSASLFFSLSRVGVKSVFASIL